MKNYARRRGENHPTIPTRKTYLVRKAKNLTSPGSRKSTTGERLKTYDRSEGRDQHAESPRSSYPYLTAE